MCIPNYFWIILVWKDCKKCEMIKIEHSKLFSTTLVGKNGKRCRMTKIMCSKWFYTPEAFSFMLIWTSTSGTLHSDPYWIYLLTSHYVIFTWSLIHVYCSTLVVQNILNVSEQLFTFLHTYTMALVNECEFKRGMA